MVRAGLLTGEHLWRNITSKKRPPESSRYPCLAAADRTHPNPSLAQPIQALTDHAAGLSQSGLASLLKVSVNTVARWEREEIAIPPYLDLALAELKRRIEKQPVSPSSAEYIRRIMREQNLLPEQVVGRAHKAGYKLSRGYLHNLLVGASVNPSLVSIYAVAEGINRPAEEVIAAFADVVRPRKPGRPRKSTKKKVR